MIIFLYGPDEYRRQQKKKSIIVEFRKKHGGLGIESFDLADKEQPMRFADFSRSQSLFEPEKLAILENLYEEGDKEFGAVLKQAAKQENLTTLISEKAKADENFSFLGGKSATIRGQKFDYLKGKEWEAFAAKEADTQGLKLSPPALRFLAQAYERNTWGLVTELQKISLLAATPQSIDERQLASLGVEVAPDFWKTINGVKNCQLDVRLESLETLFSANEPLPKIFNMLLYQWPEKLERLAQYDLLIKSGKLDYEEALVDAVLS